ncbi:hypothetical protein Hhel01_01264 [Haloferula helveola]
MAPRADGVEVVWAVNGSCLGRIEWTGPEGIKGSAAADAFGMTPQGNEVLRVRIDGWKPGSEYRLRAVTESADRKRAEESEWKDFRTLDPAADSTSFVVWNDTHENHETLKALHEGSPGGDFMIWNGDTCNDWHKEEWLVPTLLDPAGQDFTAGRPLMLVWGNHDVRGRWAYRVPEFVATPANKPYYAFRSGPVAAVCLHTGEDKPDAHPSFGGRVAFERLREEQAAWLEEVTASPGFREAPYRVVFCHIPLRWTTERVIERSAYGNGSYDYYSKFSRDLWHDALVKWGAQVVVSGHTHQVAWMPGNDDFPYAQLTGGGPQPDRATWIEGKADGKSLSLVVKGLNGEELQNASFKPLR